MSSSIIGAGRLRRVTNGLGRARRMGVAALSYATEGSWRNQLPSLEQLLSLGWWAAQAQATLAGLLAICALALWTISLSTVNIGAMNDLGLVSVLPISCFIALGFLTMGFCLTLPSAHKREHSFALTLYILALIFMLYATPALIEQEPRFQVTYWLAGHTEYLLRNGKVDPFLDAYFNWPGFFVLTGLITSATGSTSVLVFAQWASFVYNLLYLAPMYLIYTSATRDRRLVWLGLWLFYITDWVWQDYFSPQGLNLFFYLVIIAILMKWFRTTKATPRHITVWTTDHARLVTIDSRSLLPGSILERAWTRAKALAARERNTADAHSYLTSKVRQWLALSDTPLTPEQRRRRIALLVTLIGVFGLSIASHPITPFFVLLSVTALVLFGRITPRWLPILMGVMIVGWDFTVAMPYMAGHLSHDLAEFGNLQASARANVTGRLAVGSPEHQFIAQVRLLATAAAGGIALLGAALRWRPNALWYADETSWGVGSLFRHDVTYILLAFMPFLMVVVQPYGGEMAMRSYLISLPVITFFAASALCTPFVSPISGKSPRAFTFASIAVTTAVCLTLLTGFMFARYGNERADYVTSNESSAVAYLYSVAPPGSLLLQGWTGTPWRYMDLEKYDYFPLYPGYGDATAIEDHNISGILSIASNSKYPATYVIITRTQKAQAEMFYSVPPSAFTSVERALLASGKFVLIYSNADADVLMYIHPWKGNVFATRPFTDAPIVRKFWQ